MVFSLTWLPEVLEAAGLKVAETEGWRSRGRAEMGTVRGVMCHHTATARGGNMPTLGLLINGRPQTKTSQALAGPLAQLGLGRDGTFYVVAAGRANHAGAGSWEGVTTGNSSFIGIEAENSGLPGDPWPDAQMDAYRRGVAAILRKIGAEANMCCGHKEYALPKGRKPDPSFDMPSFRSEVAALLAGKSPPPPIPAQDDAKRPTLRRGARGPFVKQMQKLLGVAADGVFGPNTEAALRAFQRTHKLVPDGIAGPKSWAALAAPAGAGAPAAAAVPARTASPAAAGLPPADDADHKPRLADNKALTPDGRTFARTERKGFFSNGDTSLRAWLDSLPAPPASASPSVVRVVAAMSANEGRLEAVNSYDGCHMSFGIFQWTAGLRGDEGELPVLLREFKAADPAGYQDCFGRYGLDVQVAGASSMTGLLLLDGKVLRTSADKDVFRSVTWAYRFWRSGHHPSMRLSQLNLAAGRIKRFSAAATAGRPLRDWLSSELGIALVLDEHVNRPGHVPGTLRNARTALGSAVPPDPSGWTTADERKLIDAYIAKRNATNMTDPGKRSDKIIDFVGRNQLSADRNSFVPG
jgi:peptidoglycan hydrolase-like protein with peptidoglycan-binding domain